jgi:hypothetical protein
MDQELAKCKFKLNFEVGKMREVIPEQVLLTRSAPNTAHVALAAPPAAARFVRVSDRQTLMLLRTSTRGGFSRPRCLATAGIGQINI